MSVESILLSGGPESVGFWRIVALIFFGTTIIGGLFIIRHLSTHKKLITIIGQIDTNLEIIKSIDDDVGCIKANMNNLESPININSILENFKSNKLMIEGIQDSIQSLKRDLMCVCDSDSDIMSKVTKFQSSLDEISGKLLKLYREVEDISRSQKLLSDVVYEVINPNKRWGSQGMSIAELAMTALSQRHVDTDELKQFLHDLAGKGE